MNFIENVLSIVNNALDKPVDTIAVNKGQIVSDAIQHLKDQGVTGKKLSDAIEALNQLEL